MQIEALKLHFTGPLHISSGSTDLDRTDAIYHSDALKSALFAVGLAYYPEWEKDPGDFFNSFAISSLFPFCGNELFLPRPFASVQFQFSGIAEERKAKKAKKLAFISAVVLKEWLQNQNELEVKEQQVSPDGSYLFSTPNAKAFLHSEVQQRVQVPAEGDSRPFYFDRLYFDGGAGLYFLARFYNNAIREQVLHVLTILGEQGIGTDRTVGNGQFTFEKEMHVFPFDFEEVQGGIRHLNLGLYLPTEEETNSIDFENSSWQLIKRGGYIGGSSHEKFLSLRKNSIYFFTEGSIWQSSKPLRGKYVDLKPVFNDADLHHVYRCGQPLFLTF